MKPNFINNQHPSASHSQPVFRPNQEYSAVQQPMSPASNKLPLGSGTQSQYKPSLYSAQQNMAVLKQQAQTQMMQMGSRMGINPAMMNQHQLQQA